MKLAKKYKIKYPGPAGGCLLCEPPYAKKLKDLFAHKKQIKPEDIQLLKIGRHFRKCGKIILGKNKQENETLEQLNKKLKYNMMIPKTPGPTAIFENKNDKEFAELLIKAFSKDSELRKTISSFQITH
jgi:hypothetical protein